MGSRGKALRILNIDIERRLRELHVPSASLLGGGEPLNPLDRRFNRLQSRFRLASGDRPLPLPANRRMKYCQSNFLCVSESLLLRSMMTDRRQHHFEQPIFLSWKDEI
jgi:hypothetical protein